MKARAHGPTAAADTRMCMLRYTIAFRQAQCRRDTGILFFSPRVNAILV